MTNRGPAGEVKATLVMGGRRQSAGDAAAPHGHVGPHGRPARRRAGGELRGEAVELVAARLRAIADPNRIRLMGMLNEQEASVTELADRLLTTHQNVSHHLVLLHQAGIVSRRKDGNAVRYSLIDWSGWWLIEQIATAVVEHLDDQQDLFQSPTDPA